MASPIFLAPPILLMILFHLLLATKPTYSVRIPTGITQTGFVVTLTRVRSGITSPKNQYTLNTMNDVRNGPKRVPGLPLVSPLKAFNDVYTMTLAIGTPPVEFTGIMDTGSDLIWTKCKSKFPSFFDSSKSSSFSKVNDSCESFQLFGCKQKYEDGRSVSVTLGHETLTFGAEKIPDVIFACGTPSDNNYDGMVGMGRGKLSLVSQLKEHVFAYCFGSRFHSSETSVLLTGSKARSAFAKSDIQTMPLITPNNTPYYYISLEGISLGETILPVKKSDFAISNEDGGMIIDSGTTFMYLEKNIVNIISNEFMKQTKLKKLKGQQPYNTLEHCFKSPTHDLNIPKLVFHFKGANWELPKENYVYEKDGVACLAIIANHDNEKVSVFGNMQQQNMMVLYDLNKNTLSFKPANCNKL